MKSQWEKVTGPVRGYFIAAYAQPARVGEREYVSYFKVCASRPQSYFDEATILHKGSPHAASADAPSALQVAIRKATELVAAWPEASELPASIERRTFFCWEAMELGLL